jgi:catechol 2,3-dioxygenase-like lactoylglutathione lyase family enzyme
VRDLRARRIIGFGLTSADAALLTEFYVRAFGARPISSEHLPEAGFEPRMGGAGGVLRHELKLGDESLDILQFDTPGRPYPRPLSPDDTVFQHFAIVVGDMGLAMTRLEGTEGWRPISIDGPQRLPHSSGGVIAFKFQDPEGHPLELLQFPDRSVPAHWRGRSGDETCLGIDHSALSVRDTAISVAFYRTLGFGVAGRTFNHGEAQARLDGLPSPELEVTALSLDAATPHLELLCYRSQMRRPRQVLECNDVAATRIALAAAAASNGTGAAQRLITDPDGHHLLVIA